MSTPKKPIVTICSSVNFYKQAVQMRDKLQKKGFQVIIPATAELMEKSNDYEVSHYKTWYGNEDDYHKKTKLMRGHFDEVAKADAILVLNFVKHGIENYIGGNVLMEMALAFHLKKPVYILNEIPSESSFMEEIKGLDPIVLHGKLDKLAEKYL